MNAGRDAGIARSQRAREELAKAWLLDILDRTPAAEVPDVPVEWVMREGPALIADVLRGLSDPVAAVELELPADGIERINRLATLRQGEAAMRIPRDLAALQALLVEALRREVPERRVGAFAGTAERLAAVFGDIQSQVLKRLVSERSGGATVDPLSGLPGADQLRDWLGILLAEHSRSGQPFSLTVFDVEGLARINDAYGRDAGDRMLAAIGGVIRRQIRPEDRAFRLGGDEFGVLAPGQTATRALPLAEHLASLVDRSQVAEGPRIAITAGLVSCPEHGTDAEALLGAADEATWAAKAAGSSVGVGSV